jgi:acyl carrier protein
MPREDMDQFRLSNPSETLSRRIIAIVAEVAAQTENSISVSSDFEALGLDSLDRLEVVTKLEDGLDIVISAEQVQMLRSVNDLIERAGQLLNSKVRHEPPPPLFPQIGSIP